MFCKNCGKEIADDSKFCSQCGCACAVEYSETNNNSSNENLPPEIVELRNFFLDKMFLLPKYVIERHYNDKNMVVYGIYSQAICIGSNITQDSKKIVLALTKIAEYETNAIREWSDSEQHKYWHFAIKEAFKELKNKKIGEFYLITAYFRPFCQDIVCVVKISGLFGKYEYIAGIIFDRK